MVNVYDCTRNEGRYYCIILGNNSKERMMNIVSKEGENVKLRIRFKNKVRAVIDPTESVKKRKE